MTTMLLEVRDVATTIPVLAMRLGSLDEKAKRLLRRAGFGRSDEEHAGYVFVWNMTSGGVPRVTQATTDPFSWSGRTMQEAHRYIRENFSKLKDGDVIDVEFILGETSEPKRSELW